MSHGYNARSNPGKDATVAMRDRRNLRHSSAWVLGLFLACLHIPLVLGEIRLDPKPAFRWEELLNCEQVILAKYKSPQEKMLSLGVVRVLKGPNLKPGDVVPVALEHWYSVETGPIGWETWRKDAKSDGIPKLCYKQQIINPGEPVPVRVVADVREPAVYFLRKADRPVLERQGQVQPEFLADGWQQALAGTPMNLAFRLVQPVNRELAREALEELQRTRDAATLDQLFTWVGHPPLLGDIQYFSAQAPLLAIGDRLGDVYDRAWKRFRDHKQPNDRYQFHALARILVAADRDRAGRDLTQLIEKGPISERQEVAVYKLGYVADEKTLRLLLDLLRQPRYAGPAVSALRTMLNPWGIGDPARLAPAERARLLAIAWPKVKDILASPDLAEQHKPELRGIFRDLATEAPAIDLARAEKVLLNPDDKAYHGWADGEGHKLLEAFRHASDPKVIPLLVKILRDVPPARGPHGYSFHQALLHYATLCPNAMKRELARQGLDKGVGKDDGRMAYDVSTRLHAVLRTPYTVTQLTELLRQRGGQAWLNKQQPTPELVAALKKFLEHYVADSSGPPHDLLAAFMQLAPDEARPLLDKAVERRDQYRATVKAEILAVAVRFGRKDLRDEFFKTAEALLFMPLGKDADVDAGYLKTLDATKDFQVNPYNNVKYLDYDYERMLMKLFPAKPAEYFERVLALLASQSADERQAGQARLEVVLHWNFGFDSQAFAPQRAEQLAKLSTVLKKLAGLSEVEMRAHVLHELGVKLDGNPSRAWLPALTQAALIRDPAVAHNALLLIEEIAGEYGCADLHASPPAQRERALAAFLDDRGLPQPKP